MKERLTGNKPPPRNRKALVSSSRVLGAGGESDGDEGVTKSTETNNTLRVPAVMEDLFPRSQRACLEGMERQRLDYVYIDTTAARRIPNRITVVVMRQRLHVTHPPKDLLPPWSNTSPKPVSGDLHSNGEWRAHRGSRLLSMRQASVRSHAPRETPPATSTRLAFLAHHRRLHECDAPLVAFM